MRFDQPDSSLSVCKPDVEVIKELKADRGTDIYLCGGGEFAGWLLGHEQIDVLKVKLNPFIQGEGVRLFGNTRKTVKTQLIDTDLFEKGLQIMTYRIKYNKHRPQYLAFCHTGRRICNVAVLLPFCCNSRVKP